MMNTWTERVVVLPGWGWFALIFLALFLTVILQIVGGPLATGAAPAGIVSFEFAGNLEQVEKILTSWDQEARLHAALSLGLDYLYLVVYALAIGATCLKAAAFWRGKRTGLARLGFWLGWSQGVAALLDAIENLALIRLLFGATTPFWPPLAQICATVKFLLVLSGLVYVLLTALLYLLRRVAPNATKSTRP